MNNQDYPNPVTPAQSPTTGGVNASTDGNLVSQYSSQSQMYPLESLEVYDPVVGQTESPNSVVRNAFAFSKRKAMIVSLLITLVVTLITGLSMLILVRNSPDTQDSAKSVKPQNVVIKDADESRVPKELQGAEASLLINGDLITRGSLKVSDGGFVTVIRAQEATADQTLILPNSSGVICVDSNNCGFATNTQLNDLQSQIDAFSQITLPTAGVNDINGQRGSVGIQGSLNQISVSTSGGTLTLSTPQNLDANANVQFGNLGVSSTGQIQSNRLVQTGVGNSINIDAGADMISFTAGGRVFQLPNSGPASQTICTTGASCATGSGSAVLLAPTTVQTDGTADASIFINDVGGGQLIRLQSGGVDRLSVANNGDTTINGSLTISGLASGFVRSTAGALNVVSAIDLSGADVTNTLPVNRGGTGSASLLSNGVLVGNGTSPVSSVVAGAAGQCLISTAGVPSFQACPGSGGVASVNGETGAITIVGTSNQINVATASGTLTLSTPQNIHVGAAPTFAGLTLSGLGSGPVRATAGLLGTGDINLGSEVAGLLGVTFGGTGVSTTPSNGQLLIGNGTGYSLGSLTAGSGITITPGAGSITIAAPGAGSCAACANQALSNLSGVAINTSLLSGSSTIDLGSNAAPFRDLYLGGSGTNNFRFTGVATSTQTITIPDASGTLAVSAVGPLSLSAAGQLSLGTVGIANGGTGATSAANARTNLGAAASGANGDITSTTALNNITPTGALTIGATGQIISLQGNASSTFSAGNGANITTLGFAAPSGVNTITFPALTGTVCVSSGNCAAAGTAGGDLTGTYPNPTIAKLQNTNLNISGPTAGQVLIYNGTNSRWENHSIISDVTISETGTATIANNAVTTTKIADGNVTNAKLANSSLTVTAGSGLSGGGSVSLGASTSLAVVYGSSANTSVQGNTAVTITAGTGLTGGSTITLGAGGSSTLNVSYGSSAGTAVEGNRTLTCASGTGNLSGGGNVVTLGAGGTCNNLTITNSPIFSGTLAVQGATATIGANSQQGSVVLYDGGTGAASHTGTVQVIGSLGQNTTYILPDPVGATATICLSTGNCAGAGGGITGTGTPGALAKFNTSNTVADSTLSESGSTVTATGNLIIQGANSLTLGTSSSFDGSIRFYNAMGTKYVALQAPATDPATDLTFRLPSSYGSNGDCLQSNGSGGLTFTSCTGGAGGGVTSLDSQTGVVNLANASGSGGTVTIDNASTSAKGIAQFNGTNFSDSAGVINTIQNIDSTAAPTFAGLTLSGLNSVGLVRTNGSGTLSTGTLSRNDTTYLSNNLDVANGGTNASTAAGARTNLGAAASGANSDITSLTGLTTALSAGQGGTGIGNYSVGDLLYASGASTLSKLAAVASGSCLVSNGVGVAPSWSVCPGSGGVSSVNTFTGAVTVQGTTNQVVVSNNTGTITLSTPQDINTTSAPQFSGLGLTGTMTFSGVATDITTGSNEDLTLVANGTGTLVLNDTATVAGLLSANGGIQTNGAAIATSNGALTLGSGNLSTTGTITSGLINGQTISSSANFTGSVTIQGANSLALGTSSSLDGSIAFRNAAGSNTVSLQAPTTNPTSSFSLKLPSATGSNNDCLKTDASGNLFFGGCAAAGSGVTSLNGLSGALTLANASGAGSTVTIDDATTAAKGIASFSSTNFAVTAGAVTIKAGGVTSTELATDSVITNKIADGNVTDTKLATNSVTTTKIADGNVTNAKLANSSLTVTAGTGLSGGGSVALGASTSLAVVYGSTANTSVQGNTAVTITAGTGLTGGSTITLGAGGSSTLNVAYGSSASTAVEGNTALTCASGTGNLSGGGTVITLGSGGTCGNISITNSPVFTGTLAVQGATATIGANSQQGSVVLYDGGTGAASHTGTVQVIGNLAQNTTYILPDPGGASATICLSTGNCAGAGGGITGTGTPGALAKFNTSGTIADSTLSESGSTVTATGNVIIQGANSLILGTSSSLDGSIAFRNDSGSNTVSLQAPSANPAGNLVFKLPSSDGSASDCLKTDASGNLFFGSCAAAGSGVTSLDGLSGALTISNSSGVGSTITIDDATTAAKGIASFSSTNFAVTSGAVTIKTGGVTSTELATDAVTTVKIANGNVTNAKLANDSVTVTAGTNLANGGTVALGGAITLNVVNNPSFSGVITSTVLTGTAPLTVASTTLVTNFNADMLDGQHGAFYQDASNLNAGVIASARLSGSYTGITGLGTVTVGTWQGDAIADAYLQDNITISSAGSVDWTALNTYPAACGAGQAVTQLGDTITCTAFAAGSGSGSYIQNQNASQQATSNFWISGTGRADTSVTTPLLDTATAVALNIGTTNATAINLNKNVVVAASQSLTITGGATGTRPGSPTEGMLYFDTTTKQLLTYANGKWQGDRSSVTKIIAPSNASQTAKDSADVVLTGTADQTLINTALTAAAGGKIYLMEGTINVTDSILIPNNTTLAGAGVGTLITIPNAQNGSYGIITNTTTGGSGTGVTIQDLRVDGNKANQTSGNMYGIHLDGLGSGTGAAAVPGANVSNVRANNIYGNGGMGILVNSSSNNTITGNNTQGNATYGIFLTASSHNTITGNTNQGNTTHGIYLSSSSNNTITGNTNQGNGSSGILLNSSSNNTITGNTNQGNTNNGIYLTASSNNTITGNATSGNANTGISLFSSSNSNTISGNKINDNGGATSNNGISVSNSDFNLITGNNITDTSATTSNFAISVSDTGSDANYLADNTLGTGSVNDQSDVTGGFTIYGGQVNSSGNFVIQPAGTIELIKDTNITGTLNITSDVDTNGSLTVGNANQFVISNTGIVTAGTWQGTAIADAYLQDNITISSSGSVDWTALNAYPAACGAGQAITQLGDTITCTSFAAGSGSGSYIQNQNAGAQATSNFWISGSGRADTSLLTPLLDTATGVALDIGTTNATAINLNENVTVAASKTLRITGDNTAGRPVTPPEGTLYYDTTTKQLLTYANGKWQGDRTTTTKIVAASNSSQASKDAADYLADGTNDETEINSAITAVNSAGGGVVYLMEGTYTISATISTRSKVTLSGAGTGTIITLPNSLNPSIDMISESTNPTEVFIRNLTIDGNRTGQASGTVHAMRMIGVGSGSGTTAVNSITVDGVTVRNVSGRGIHLQDVVHATITGTTITNNGGYGIYLVESGTTTQHITVANSMIHGSGDNGIYMSGGASDIAITNNVIEASAQIGIDMTTVTNVSITGNVLRGNLRGLGFSTSSQITVSGNTVVNNTSTGVYMNGGPTLSTFSGNTVANNGAYGFSLGTSVSQNSFTGNNVNNNANHGFYIANSSNNTDNMISGNTISTNTGSGVYLWADPERNSIIGNTIRSNTSTGVTVAGANHTLIQNNQLYNNGGSGSSSSIYIDDSTGSGGNYTQVIGNRIEDTAGTGYAIDIADSILLGTYLADNTYSGTGATTINNASTSTTFGGQLNSTGNYVIQPATTKTIELIANTNVTGTLTATTLASTVATGTAPLTVASTTLVTNLNADLLDGQSGSFYQDAGNINAGTLAVNRGGTGAGTFTQYGVLFGNGTSAVGVTAVGSTGQCLLSGNGAAAPSWGTCTPSSLQSVYDASSPATILLANSKDFTINAQDTATDSNIIFNLQCATCSIAGGRFAVQDSGVDVFTVNPNGDIVVGRATDGITFTAASGYKSTASGTARQVKSIFLPAEFAGAVLDNSDTGGANCSVNSSGTMTSGYDGASRMNNYQWTSSQTSSQCYNVVVQVPIPYDWAAWDATDPINVQIKKSTNGGTAYAIGIVDSAGAADANYGAAYTSPGTLGTSWGDMATSTLSGTYTAGNYMTIKLRLTASQVTGNNGIVYLGNITLNYLSKY